MKILYCASFENTCGGKKIADEHHLAEALSKNGHKVFLDDFFKSKGVGAQRSVDVVLFGKLSVPRSWFNYIRKSHSQVPFIAHHYENMYAEDQSYQSRIRSRLWREQLPIYDVVITTANVNECFYGAKDWRLIHNCFKDYEVREIDWSENRVLFVGNMSPQRESLIKFVRDKYQVDVVNNVFNVALAELIQKYRVVLNFNHWAELGKTWNDRFYIVPGNGGLLLTNYSEGMDTQGEINEHFLVYSSADEMMDRLGEVFSGKHDHIRKKARKHFRENHTFRNRAKKFIDVFEDALSETVSR